MSFVLALGMHEVFGDASAHEPFGCHESHPYCGICAVLLSGEIAEPLSIRGMSVTLKIDGFLC